VSEHPDDGRWHTALGQAYALLGRKQDADREGRRAVELLPVSRDAWDGALLLENLAEIHARTGDVDAAVGELDQLLSIPSHISPGLLRIEERWAALRSDPRFVKLTGNR
jgi:Flp pilus assembly protein TadD